MSTTTAERPARIPSRFERLAAWSARHHWHALVLWVVALVAAVGASVVVGADFRDDHTLPGSESQAVADAFADQGAAVTDTVTVVVHDEGGVDLADDGGRIETMLSRLAAMDFVERVGEPVLSEDTRTVYADVTLDTVAADTEPADVRELIDLAQESDGNGLVVELGGDAVRSASEAGGAAEGIGLIAALMILIPLFGSVLAASLPVVAAIFAVGTAVGVITLASHVATVPSYGVPMMALVGLGVGIDYALLIFSRYRSELVHGADRDDAAARALDTAGRSVLFAGVTVIIALLGLLVLGLGSLQGLALSVALTVLMTMLASITLLPALLSVFGRRLEASVACRSAKRTRVLGDRWRRWAALVQRRPVVSLAASAAVLALLMLPALDLRLGFADAGTDAPAQTSRQAYDLVSEGFGPGANGPLVILVDGDPSAVQEAVATLEGTDGVAGVVPPEPGGGGGPTTLIASPEPCVSG